MAPKEHHPPLDDDKQEDNGKGMAKEAEVTKPSPE